MFIQDNQKNKDFTQLDLFKEFKKIYYTTMSNLSLTYSRLKMFKDSITLDIEV